MNLIIDTLIVFLWPIVFAVFICACIGWIVFIFGEHCEVDIKDMTIRHGFRDLTIICMDCNRHLSGPPIGKAEISHGLCKACADLRWTELSNITEREREITKHDPLSILQIDPAARDAFNAARNGN